MVFAFKLRIDSASRSNVVACPSLFPNCANPRSCLRHGRGFTELGKSHSQRLKQFVQLRFAGEPTRILRARAYALARSSTLGGGGPRITFVVSASTGTPAKSNSSGVAAANDTWRPNSISHLLKIFKICSRWELKLRRDMSSALVGYLRRDL